MTRSSPLHIIEAVRGWMQTADPWSSLLLFAAASALMIWRLGVLERKGFEGTVLGTLIMPYCSGLPNLAFAFVVAQGGGSGVLVLENGLVNNATNLTLLLGLPAMCWPLAVVSENKRTKTAEKAMRLNRLSLAMTLIAAVFFSGVLWTLGADGVIDVNDGLVLVGLFLFWQLFHVIEVLKTNVRHSRSMPGTIGVDLLLILVSGYGTYASVSGLVAWVTGSGQGWLAVDNLGWLSGLLMVLPNALLAIYYARAKRAEVVVSSQVGDAHICIPMCVGLVALFSPVSTMHYFHMGLAVVMGAAMLHLILVATIGRLSRIVGVFLVVTYGVFLWKGVIP